VPPERAVLTALYDRYLLLCNERRFEELAELVSDEVSGSGAADGRAAYVDRVRDVCVGFPDYHWDLQAVVVEGDTIAARLIGHGTHTGTFVGLPPTGRAIEIQELVVYRFTEGKVVQCWGDLFPVVRDALTAPEGAPL
jgi:predicted ester cyclase